MVFPKLTLRRIAVQAPENLVLCRTGELVDLCASAGCDPVAIGSSLAELVVRWLIGDSLVRGNPSSEMQEIEASLRASLGNGGIPVSLLQLRMYPDSAYQLFGECLWQTANDCQREIELAVRRRLWHLYTRTDGFIPVYDTGDGRASFIPFTLAQKISDDDSVAVDVSTDAGLPIPAWEEPARSVLRGSGKRMIVSYRQREDMPPLSGNSFMLPLTVALMRSDGRLPKFLPWTMLFTGAIDAAGGLVPVARENKLSGVKARFQSSVRLVAPSDTPYEDEVGGIDPLNIGLRGDELLEALRSRVEALPGCQMTWQYADARMPVLEDQIRHGTVDRWERQIERVDAMLRIFGPHVEPNIHLKLLMLKSAAYCHAGRTSAALATNHEAYSLAVSAGLYYDAMRLQIEELVEFQDTQRFDDIMKLEKSLASRINDDSVNLNDVERNDLRMRFSGTMGQVWLERSVLDSDEEKARVSLDLINKALVFARKGGKPEEIIQDVNYRHLWLAYWQPCGVDEIGAFTEAMSLCKALPSDECRFKNLAYLQRQKAIALFLSWKRTGLVPDDWRFLQKPHVARETWVKASFVRMKGALAAAAGETASAVRIFAEGENSFPLEKWWSAEGDAISPGAVFAQIRLSLLVQGCCSLAGTCHEESARYGRLAAELVAACPGVKKRSGVEALLAFLRDPSTSDPRSLPLMYY